MYSQGGLLIFFPVIRSLKIAIFALFLGLPYAVCCEPLRVGHFPNVTHAQGVIGHELTRQNHGWFEETSEVPIEWYVYNAGPSAMEALLAGSIDIAYVGPNPALNAFVRSSTPALHVVAGATRGGSALLVRRGSALKSANDFRGKKIATPQFGNTQDVNARAWLIDGGLTITQTGGDASIIPTPTSDQLLLFQRGDLDAVWTVEPWVSQLELDAEAEILVNEVDTITTVLVVSARAYAERREVVERFVRRHRELCSWMNQHPEEARTLLSSGLKNDTGRLLSAELVLRAWSRLRFSSDIDQSEFEAFLERAQRVGFMKNARALNGFVMLIE